jgi:DNA polymerase-4
MRAAGRIGRTVVLRLRFADYARATRSHTLPLPTASTAIVLATARALLAEAVPTIERRGLTLVGVAVANLSPAPPVQLALQAQEAVDAAVDAVRDRFGSDAITRAVLLGRRRGVAMPLLPD